MTPGKSDEEEEEDGTTPSESPRPGDRGGERERCGHALNAWDHTRRQILKWVTAGG